jgi:7-cyano-7-deazaguanine synthase in queuosine biosynthesis
MEEKNRVPLILFSGGLDSSFALQEKLKEGDVETLYVSGAQHPWKIKKERETRERIVRRLQHRTGNKVRQDHHIQLDNTLFGGMADHAFCQPAMWIMGALQVSDIRVHSELIIAYVSGDQISSKIQAVAQAWHSMQEFSKNHGIVPVNFPLSVWTKQQIMRDIFPDIAQHVWVCELPIQKDDGRIVACNGGYQCAACNTRAMNHFLWKKTHNEHYWQSKLREYRYWQKDNPRLAAMMEDDDLKYQQKAAKIDRLCQDIIDEPESQKVPLLVEV